VPRRLSTPKKIVEVVGDAESDDTALVFRSHGDCDLRVPFDTIVGIRFEIRHEKLRDEVDGQLVVVTRTDAVGLRQWASWLLFVVFGLATAYSVHQISGPFTSLLLMIGWAVSVTLSFYSTGQKNSKNRNRKQKLRARSLSMTQQNPKVRRSPITTPEQGSCTPPTMVVTPPLSSSRTISRITSSMPSINLNDEFESPPGTPQRYFKAASKIDEIQELIDSKSRREEKEKETKLFTNPLEPDEDLRALARAKIRLRASSKANLLTVRKIGPDGTGVPLGPLINWSGQLSVFYLAMWHIPGALGVMQIPRLSGCIVAACILIILRAGRHSKDGKLKALWHERAAVGPFGSIRLFRPPVPTFPIRIKFSQADLPKLFNIRSALLAVPAGRAAVRDVAVGGYWSEGITSALLPSGLYNSRRLRQLGHVMMNFLIPAFFILQGLSVLVPWAYQHAVRLGALLGKDIGMHLMRKLLGAVGAVIARSAHSFTFLLPDFAKFFSRLAFPVRIIASFTKGLLRSAVQIVLNYIVPSDTVLTYMRARFAELQSLASPAFQLVSRLSTFISNFVRMLTAPIFALIQLLRHIAAALGSITLTGIQALFDAIVPLVYAGIYIIRVVLQPVRVIILLVVTTLQLILECIATLVRAVANVITAVLLLVRNLALRVPGLAKFAKQISDQLIVLQKRDPLFWSRMRSVALLLSSGIFVSIMALLLSPAMAVALSVGSALPFILLPSLRDWLVEKIRKFDQFPSNSTVDQLSTPPPSVASSTVPSEAEAVFSTSEIIPEEEEQDAGKGISKWAIEYPARTPIKGSRQHLLRPPGKSALKLRPESGDRRSASSPALSSMLPTALVSPVYKGKDNLHHRAPK